MYMKNVNYLSTELFTIICPRQKSVYNMYISDTHNLACIPYIAAYFKMCVYVCIFDREVWSPSSCLGLEGEESHSGY